MRPANPFKSNPVSGSDSPILEAEYMGNTKQIRVRISVEAEESIARLEDKGIVLAEVAAVFATSKMPFDAFVAQIKNWARAQNYVWNAKRKEQEASKLLAKAKLDLQAIEDERGDMLDRMYFAAMMAAISKQAIPGIDEWTRAYADKHFSAVANSMFQYMTRDYKTKRAMLFALVESMATYFSEHPDEFSKVSPAEQRMLATMIEATRAWKQGLEIRA